MPAKQSNQPTEFLLRDVLVRLGISQRGFAKLSGKSLDWVGRIVRGTFRPSWESAVGIADVLQVSIGVFRANDPARVDFFQRGHTLEVSAPPPPTAAARKTKAPPANAAGAKKKPRRRNADVANNV